MKLISILLAAVAVAVTGFFIFSALTMSSAVPFQTGYPIETPAPWIGYPIETPAPWSGYPVVTPGPWNGYPVETQTARTTYTATPYPFFSIVTWSRNKPRPATPTSTATAQPTEENILPATQFIPVIPEPSAIVLTKRFRSSSNVMTWRME